MKVLYLSHSYPAEGRENITPFIRFLAESIASAPQVELTALLPEQSKMSLEHGALVTFSLSKENRLPHKRIGKDHTSVRFHHKLEYLTKALIAARKLVAQEAFELVHAHWLLPSGLIALFLRKLYGIPYVITTHGRDVIYETEFGYDVSGSWLNSTLMRLILQNAAQVCCTSPVTTDGVKRLCSNISSCIIPVGLDRQWFNEFSPPSPRGNGILFVGDLIPLKGTRLLLEAVGFSPYLRELPLRIVGDGAERTSLETQAHDLGLKNIEFLGFLNRAELSEMFRCSQLLVMTSHIEGFGIVLLEALAAGLRVVSSNTGIAPYLQSHEVFRKRCVVFENRDPGALSSLLEDSIQAEESVSHQTILASLRNEFDWGVVTKRYVGVYQKVLENR